MKKITLATVKSFVKKNAANLHINTKTSFDGMTDCCMPTGSAGFAPARPAGFPKDTLGVAGAWFVGGSRNHFNAYNENGFTGIEVSNCCGRFILAIPA